MASCCCALESSKPTCAPNDCPRHRTPEPHPRRPQEATPTPGVPLVDLGATIRDLLDHAEACRVAREGVTRAAEQMRTTLADQATYLENLAAVLGGTR